jgi:hypothetical protein
VSGPPPGRPRPPRVRVTSPRTTGPATRRTHVLVATLVGGLPLFFHLAPRLSRTTVLGMPLAWGLLGFVVYPVMLAMGWAYVRRAERNERTFTDMVEET